MDTIGIVFLASIPLAVVPSWKFLSDSIVDNREFLIAMTILFSLTGWVAILVWIAWLFERKRTVRELLEFHFSEANEMERKYKELQLKKDFGMNNEDAFIKSVKYMELMHGEWWFLRGPRSETEDRFKADQIRWRMEEYLSEKTAGRFPDRSIVM